MVRPDGGSARRRVLTADHVVTREPLRRYEHPHPRSLIQVDVPNFGNIPDVSLRVAGLGLAGTVSGAHPFVIGVDIHARTHTLAVVVSATGEPIATEQFPTTDAGLQRAAAWAARRTGGDLAALWVIEGVATYGARLASAASRVGYEIVEAPKMDARAHRGTGKSGPLDARRIAVAVLPLEQEQLRRPRCNGGT